MRKIAPSLILLIIAWGMFFVAIATNTILLGIAGLCATWPLFGLFGWSLRASGLRIQFSDEPAAAPVSRGKAVNGHKNIRYIETGIQENSL